MSKENTTYKIIIPKIKKIEPEIIPGSTIKIKYESPKPKQNRLF